MNINTVKARIQSRFGYFVVSEIERSGLRCEWGVTAPVPFPSFADAIKYCEQHGIEVVT